MPSIGEKTQRDKKGRFVQGNEGGGRKPLPADVKEMFRAATSDAARLLIDTMQDEGQEMKLRLDCANKIIERVYGKASQPIDGAIDNTVRFVLDGAVADYGG